MSIKPKSKIVLLIFKYGYFVFEEILKIFVYLSSNVIWAFDINTFAYCGLIEIFIEIDFDFGIIPSFGEKLKSFFEVILNKIDANE